MGRVFYRTSSLEPLTSSSITVQHMLQPGSQARQRIQRFVPRCCRKRRQMRGGLSHESNAAAGRSSTNGVSQTPTRLPSRQSKSAAGAGARLGLTPSGAHVAAASGEPSHDDECSDDSSDSETETSPEWLRQFVCAQIDDFTDLNPGEKRLMTLWNMHQLRHMLLYSFFNFIHSSSLYYRLICSQW